MLIMKPRKRNMIGKKSLEMPLNRKLIKMLRFLLLFNLFAVPLYLFMAFNISIYPMQIFTARVVHSSLLIAGASPEIDGIDITIPSPDGDFTGAINWDCTGWKSILAFMALVFATEEVMRKKIYSLAFLPLIYAVNISRVTYIFLFVSSSGLSGYETLHNFLFGFFMIAVILTFWMAWLMYFNVEKPRKRIKKRGPWSNGMTPSRHGGGCGFKGLFSFWKRKNSRKKER